MAKEVISIEVTFFIVNVLYSIINLFGVNQKYYIFVSENLKQSYQS